MHWGALAMMGYLFGPTLVWFPLGRTRKDTPQPGGPTRSLPRNAYPLRQAWVACGSIWQVYNTAVTQDGNAAVAFVSDDAASALWCRGDSTVRVGAVIARGRDVLSVPS